MVDKKIQIPRASEQFLQDRKRPPIVSKQMATSVSQVRRGLLEEEVAQGGFNITGGVVSSSANQTSESFGPTRAGLVVSNQKLTKMASTSTSTSGGWRGGGGTLRQSPDIYSPLWLNSNLNLPRDRATINAWSRAFFALNGIVQSAISLHSTYPISKLNIKCKNPEIEKFFADMIEEIDLMNVCVQLAQEYWILGEAFVYAELDEDNRKWSRLLIQNPDYMIVQRSVVADEPVISLRPDENLKRICTKNGPLELQQRQKLDVSIVEHVRRGENIPLNNFFISHLARKINPYDVRGTGLIVSSFRQLMLFDELRECYSSDTEVLTDQGFKSFKDVIDYKINSVGTISANPKLEFKIACFNSDNNQLEYHSASRAHVSHYMGKMYNFKGQKVDVCVTPEHDMWVKEKNNNIWGNWGKQTAETIANKNKNFKFLSHVDWQGETVDKVNVCGHEIPIDIYLKFLGYLISEGCIYKNYKNGRYDAEILLTQFVSSPYYESMKNNLEQICNLFNVKISNRIYKTNWRYKPGEFKDCWSGTFFGKGFVNHFINEIGENGEYKSKNKRIPRWVLNLNKDLLNIILNALLDGDGSRGTSKYGTNSKTYRYSTISKGLADDVAELVFKLGIPANICVSNRKIENRNIIEYIVTWSNTNYGMEPNVYPRQKVGKNGGGANIEKIPYNDLVWCLEVPTGLFITRRGGRMTIQGNCKFAQAANMINPLTLVKIGGEDFKPNAVDLDAWRQVFEEAQNDKDFKIFTHDKVTVERVGYNQGILDISPDITQLLKEIYSGLMVPSVLMDGGSDTSYANGSVALDVLRQRYLQFRNMLTIWLRRKIFAPISKINDFYEKVQGQNVLIIPEIEWNHMSLFDVDTYINMLSTLATAEKKVVSYQSLYRSLGLNWEDECLKIRQESIEQVIREKEEEQLRAMSLNDLRALGPGDEIQEVVQSPVPGEQVEPTPGEEPGGDMGMPGLSTVPPPAPAPTPAPPSPGGAAGPAPV